MAILGGNEQARDVVSKTFAAIGSSDAFTPEAGTDFNIVLTGAGTGSVQLECSYDDEATWCQLYAGGTQLYVWSYSGTALTESCTAAERGVKYRLRCTAYTSGFTGRLSQ